jgi:hypothetical protein
VSIFVALSEHQTTTDDQFPMLLSLRSSSEPLGGHNPPLLAACHDVTTQVFGFAFLHRVSPTCPLHRPARVVPQPQQYASIAHM